MVGRGEMKRSVAEEWEAATPKGKKLPEKVKKAELCGLLDELEKIGKAEKKLSREERAAHLQGVAELAGLPALGAGYLAQKGLLKIIDPSKAPYVYTNVAKAIGTSPVPEFKPITEATDAFYMYPTKRHPKGIVAATTHSPEFAAHELGHAALKSRIGKAILHNPILKAVLPPLGSYAGLMAAAVPDDPRSTWVTAAPAIAALGEAPTLVEEARASLRAMKGLRTMGLAPKLISAARGNLLKAFGTYLAGAGVRVAPLAAVLAYRRHEGI